MKTLIRGGTVLTLDREDRVLAGADVLVEDERIARVGGRLGEREGPFDRVIDASRGDTAHGRTGAPGSAAGEAAGGRAPGPDRQRRKSQRAREA